MLQNRAGELVNEVARSTGAGAARAKREVTLAIDRLVYSQADGQVSADLRQRESRGDVALRLHDPGADRRVVVLAPDEPSLLALVSLVAPVI